MKWKTIIFGLIAMSLVVSLCADPVKAPAGSNFGKETVEAIDGSGLIKLNGTTVDKEVHVIGSLIAQNGQIGSIDVIGEANLTGTTIRQGGYIMGSFQATRSKIQAPLTILSQKAVLTSSQFSGITVKKDGAYKGKQTVELRGGTIVDGPIHFESGKGEVLIFPGSQVLGPVTGGQIIKKY